jgi:hypothetical protein
MEILQAPGVQVLLWIAAVLATIWIMAPSVMIALGRRRFDVDVSENPLDAEPRGDDPVYEDRFRQLAAQGYRAVGKTLERGRFFSPLHWRWRGDVSRYMAAADGKTFVGFHRVAGANPLKTTAETILDGGGIVATTTPPNVASAPTEHGPHGNYSWANVSDMDLIDLLAAHAKRVDDFSRKRGLSVRAATLREVAKESLELGRRVSARQNILVFAVLAGVFLVPVIGMLATSSPGGRDPWFVPVGICLSAALFAVIRWGALPSRLPFVLRVGMCLAAITFVRPAELMRKARVVGALQRIDEDARHGRPLRDVDFVVQRGPGGCGPVVEAFADPATSPDARRALQGILVKLNGADLGDAAPSWRRWCEGVRVRPRR